MINTDIEKVLTDRLEAVRQEKSTLKQEIDALDARYRHLREAAGTPPKESDEEITAVITKLERLHATTPQTKADERKFMFELDKLKQKKKLAQHYGKYKDELEVSKQKLAVMRQELLERETHIDEIVLAIQKVQLAIQLQCTYQEIVEKYFTIEASKIPYILGKTGMNLAYIEAECHVKCELNHLQSSVHIVGTEERIQKAYEMIITTMDITTDEFTLPDVVLQVLAMEKHSLLNDISTKHPLVSIDINPFKGLVSITGHHKQLPQVKKELLSLQCARVEVKIPPGPVVQVLLAKGLGKLKELSDEFNVSLTFTRFQEQKESKVEAKSAAANPKAQAKDAKAVQTGPIGIVEVLGLKKNVVSCEEKLNSILKEHEEIEEYITLDRRVLLGAFISTGVMKEINKEFHVRVTIENSPPVSPSVAITAASEHPASHHEKRQQKHDTDSRDFHKAHHDKVVQRHADHKKQGEEKDAAIPSKLQYLKIFGVRENLALVKAYILEQIAYFEGNTLVKSIPQEMMAILLGKQGSTIKGFREKYASGEGATASTSLLSKVTTATGRQLPLPVLPTSIDIDMDHHLLYITASSTVTRSEIWGEIGSLFSANFSFLYPLAAEDLMIYYKSPRSIELRNFLINTLNLKIILLDDYSDPEIPSTVGKGGKLGDKGGVHVVSTTSQGAIKGNGILLRGYEKNIQLAVQKLNDHFKNYVTQTVAISEEDLPIFNRSISSTPSAAAAAGEEKDAVTAEDEKAQSLIKYLESLYDIDCYFRRKELQFFLRGAPAGVTGAFHHLQGILKGGATFGSVLIPFESKVLSAVLIGKQGNAIKKLEEELHVKCDVLKSVQLLRIRIADHRLVGVGGAQTVPATTPNGLSFGSLPPEAPAHKTVQDILRHAKETIVEYLHSSRVTEVFPLNEASLTSQQIDNTLKELPELFPGMDIELVEDTNTGKKLVVKGIYYYLASVKEYIYERLFPQLAVYWLPLLPGQVAALANNDASNASAQKILNGIQRLTNKFHVKVSYDLSKHRIQLSPNTASTTSWASSINNDSFDAAKKELIKLLLIHFSALHNAPIIGFLKLAPHCLRNVLTSKNFVFLQEHYGIAIKEDWILGFVWLLKGYDVHDQSVAADNAFEKGLLAAQVYIDSLIQKYEQTHALVPVAPEHRYLIPTLIGKGGSNINNLRKDLTARFGIQNLSISETSGSVHLLVSTESKTTSVSDEDKEQLQKGKEYLETYLSQLSKENIELKMDSDLIPLFIGKGGAHINALRQEIPGVTNIDIDAKSGSVKVGNYHRIQSFI